MANGYEDTSYSEGKRGFDYASSLASGSAAGGDGLVADVALFGSGAGLIYKAGRWAYVGARGGLAGTGIVATSRSTALIARPHGNSRLSVEAQIIYQLVTAKGKVLKYGITKAVIGQARYTQKYLESIGARFRPIMTIEGRGVGYSVERAAIEAYRAANVGVRPLLNKISR